MNIPIVDNVIRILRNDRRILAEELEALAASAGPDRPRPALALLEVGDPARPGRSGVLEEVRIRLVNPTTCRTPARLSIVIRLEGSDAPGPSLHEIELILEARAVLEVVFNHDWRRRAYFKVKGRRVPADSETPGGPFAPGLYAVEARLDRGEPPVDLLKAFRTLAGETE